MHTHTHSHTGQFRTTISLTGIFWERRRNLGALLEKGHVDTAYIHTQTGTVPVIMYHVIFILKHTINPGWYCKNVSCYVSANALSFLFTIYV